MLREILNVSQPCILCEQTMMVSIIERDDETGEERVAHEPVDHDCAPMNALLAEKTKSQYARTKAAPEQRGV